MNGSMWQKAPSGKQTRCTNSPGLRKSRKRQLSRKKRRARLNDEHLENHTGAALRSSGIFHGALCLGLLSVGTFVVQVPSFRFCSRVTRDRLIPDFEAEIHAFKKR